MTPLNELHGRGIRTIVDLTTVDLGRDIDLIAGVARRSRVNIIVDTGVWWMPQRYFAPTAWTRSPISSSATYNHIPDDILPALRKAGVKDDQIDQMLVRDPRAIFEAGR